jgi:hypothetical protein
LPRTPATAHLLALRLPRAHDRGAQQLQQRADGLDQLTAVLFRGHDVIQPLHPRRREPERARQRALAALDAPEAPPRRRAHEAVGRRCRRRARDRAAQHGGAAVALRAGEAEHHARRRRAATAALCLGPSGLPGLLQDRAHQQLVAALEDVEVLLLARPQARPEAARHGVG